MRSTGLLDRPWIRRIALWCFKHTIFRCYIGGATEKEATAMIAVLYRNRFGIISDILGEAVTSCDTAETMAARYIAHLRTLGVLKQRYPGIRLAISAKPTSFGIHRDRELARFLAIRVAEAAFDRGIGFEIDIEGPETIDRTIHFVAELAASPELRRHRIRGCAPRLAIPANQAGARRLLGYARSLGIKVRIVKGAYRGVIVRPHEIDRNFLALTHEALAAGLDTAVGTHDRRHIIEQLFPSEGRLSLQGLFGVRMLYQTELARSGFGNWVYLPWGSVDDAFRYLVRRIEEGIRPRTMILFAVNILESLLWRITYARRRTRP